MDHGLAVVARDKDLRRSADQLRDIREVNQIPVTAADRDVPQIGLALGVALRVQHLNVLGPVYRVELRGQRPAESRPHRLRGESDVHVEHARTVPVEFDVVLRCKLLCRAIDVRRSGRVGKRLENLLGIRVGFAARRRHRHVDRLRVPAARARCRDRDDLRIRDQAVCDTAHSARIRIGRFFVIWLQQNAQLPRRADVDATAESGLRRAGR